MIDLHIVNIGTAFKQRFAQYFAPPVATKYDDILTRHILKLIQRQQGLTVVLMLGHQID